MLSKSNIVTSKLLSQNWQVRSIESLCLRITSGGTPSRKNPDFYRNGTIRWIKTKELKDWYIDDSEEKITVEALNNSSAKLFPYNTILMAMYGDGITITSLGILRKESATNQACCAMIVDPEQCHFLFLFYALKYHRNDFIHLASGASQRNLNSQIIRNFQIRIPRLKTQHKIVDILSTYDRLIENNTRRIKILEEMVLLLYGEWFINFRFPGYEQVSMVESELGLIPQNWTVKSVTEAIDINPKTLVPKEGEKPFVPMSSLSHDSMLIQSPEVRAGNSGAKFKNHDTLFARITPCLENGKTGYVQFLQSDNDVAFGSTEFIVLRSKTLCAEYVYLMARSDRFRDHAIKSMTGATGRQRVQESCFNTFSFAHPEPAILAAFSRLAAPVFRQIHLLSKKNETLRKTRDLLLPKLISGEIDVEAIDTEELEAIAA